MSITLMTRYQIENKKTKYKYALYGGLQNKNKELENLELFCYFKDKKAMLKYIDRFITPRARADCIEKTQPSDKTWYYATARGG